MKGEVMSENHTVFWESKIPSQSDRLSRIRIAFYCSLRIEVLQMMKHCSLIRYGEREFIVDTADLILVDMADLARVRRARRAA
jgi:hypothetical protein